MAIYNGTAKVSAIKNGDKDVLAVIQDGEMIFPDPAPITISTAYISGDGAAAFEFTGTGGLYAESTLAAGGTSKQFYPSGQPYSATNVATAIKIKASKGIESITSAGTQGDIKARLTAIERGTNDNVSISYLFAETCWEGEIPLFSTGGLTTDNIFQNAKFSNFSYDAISAYNTPFPVQYGGLSMIRGLGAGAGTGAREMVRAWLNETQGGTAKPFLHGNDDKISGESNTSVRIVLNKNLAAGFRFRVCGGKMNADTGGEGIGWSVENGQFSAENTDGVFEVYINGVSQTWRGSENVCDVAQGDGVNILGGSGNVNYSAGTVQAYSVQFLFNGSECSANALFDAWDENGNYYFQLRAIKSGTANPVSEENYTGQSGNYIATAPYDTFVDMITGEMATAA